MFGSSYFPDVRAGTA